MDEKTLAWLKFGRAELRDSLKRRLLSKFPDPLEAVRVDFSRVSPKLESERSSKRCLEDFVDQRSLDHDIAWCSKDRHFVVGISDDRFPRLLREVSCPPVMLYCQGNAEFHAQ